MLAPKTKITATFRKCKQLQKKYNHPMPIRQTKSHTICFAVDVKKKPT
jgi:hypothetical protein